MSTQLTSRKFTTSFCVIAFTIAIINTAIKSEPNFLKLFLFAVCLISIIYALKKTKFTIDDFGLNSGNLKQIFTWSVVCVLSVVIPMTLAFLVNSDFFLDERFNKTLSQTIVYAFFAIPVFTVFIEELIFRGFIWGFIRCYKTEKSATIISSILFGFWHLLSAKNLDRSFLLNAGINSSQALLLVVIGTVFITTCAGVILCELRRRTNSLWVPIAFHWSINATGVLLAYFAWN